MPSVCYMAMWGTLQISPHPRLKKWVANEDARRWNKAHPDKPATIVEVQIA